jgi:hypothetical protein
MQSLFVTYSHKQHHAIHFAVNLELHKFIAIGQGILPYSSLERNKYIHMQNNVKSCAASALHTCTELYRVIYVYITVIKITQIFTYVENLLVSCTFT